MLQQQIISLDDHPVTSVQTIDDLDAITILNSELDLSLFIAIPLSHEDEALAVIFENCGLRYRNGRAVHIRDDLHIREHVGLQPAIGIGNLSPHFHGARNLNSPSYSPLTRLYYLGINNSCMDVTFVTQKYELGQAYQGMNLMSAPRRVQK